MTMYYSLPDKINPDGDLPPPSETLMVTGHRPNRLYGAEDWVERKLSHIISGAALKGFRHFISGGVQGADLISLKLALTTKLETTVAIPFPGQADRWPLNISQRRQELIDQADNNVLICNEPSFKNAGRCYIIRNQWMVDRSSIVIAVWDSKPTGGTSRTIKMAQELGHRIYQLNPKIQKCRWYKE